jgi:hypothetical protein
MFKLDKVIPCPAVMETAVPREKWMPRFLMSTYDTAEAAAAACTAATASADISILSAGEAARNSRSTGDSSACEDPTVTTCWDMDNAATTPGVLTSTGGQKYSTLAVRSI